MNTIAQFLKDCEAFYVATVEGDQPRVRPFGAVGEWDGKTYLTMNNQKKVYKQLMENPKVEITGMVNGKWIRLEGKLARDDRDEARAAILEQNPGLSRMYKLGDGLFEVLYFTEGKATINSFTEEPVELTL